MKKILIIILSLVLSTPLLSLPDFGAQSRIGIPGAGDWELGLFKNGSLNQTDQYSWVSGSPVNWSVSWNSTTQNLSYIWGVGSGSPETLSTTAAQSAKDYLKIWISNSNVDPLESILMSNVVLTTGMISQSLPNLFVQGPNQLAEFTFPIPLVDSFVITGQTTMTWTGGRPTRSNMQAWVSSTGSVPVPEPTSVVLLMSAVAAGIAYKRRRAQAAI